MRNANSDTKIRYFAVHEAPENILYYRSQVNFREKEGILLQYVLLNVLNIYIL